MDNLLLGTELTIMSDLGALTDKSEAISLLYESLKWVSSFINAIWR